MTKLTDEHAFTFCTYLKVSILCGYLILFYSDDDLEPYDMSGDTKVTKVKEPVYVRDCMEGKSKELTQTVTICHIFTFYHIFHSP